MLQAGHHLTVMRRTAPLVHNITNYVAMNFMANVQIAAGASPAMVNARAEAAEFAGLASALSVNIGTADPEWAGAMEDAISVMNQNGRPWVFDPVAVGATAFRRELGRKLIALRPSVVRGNASEILALGGHASQLRGVDAHDEVEAARESARWLAAQTGGVVAVTGAQDYVTDGSRGLTILNGHPMMTKVTAMGCSLTGLVAAFCAGQPMFEATAAALAYFGLAGERAAKQASGPGSFQAAFLDQLHGLTAQDLDQGARVEQSSITPP